MKALLIFFILIPVFPLSYAKTTSNTKSQTEKISKNDRKILQKFKRYLKIVDDGKEESKAYSQAVSFLESSFYRDASFETLTVLADVYKEKKDINNELKIRKVIVSNFPKNPKSYYMLGLVYKKLYYKNENIEDKKLAIENFNLAIRKNKKYEEAYLHILELIKGDEAHTPKTLSLVFEMNRYIKKPKYYIDLCEAYFETNYFKQSLRACKLAQKKNSGDPKSKMLYLLSSISLKKNKKKENELIEVANKYKNSKAVQERAAFYFQSKDKPLAIKYFQRAIEIDPNSKKSHIALSQLLFEKSPVQSAQYFLKACLLTEGGYLSEFQKAKNKVRYKNKSAEAIFIQGIDECFLESRKKKTNI